MMEIYYPPDFDFQKKLPAVILYSDHRTTIDETSYVSWAQLIAASGMVAITYQGTVACEEDFVDLARYIKKQDSFLGVNSSKIGILASEAGIARFAETIETRFEDIPLQITCAVCRIGRMPPPSELKPDFHILVLNAGRGHEGIKHSVEMFRTDAMNLDIDRKILDYTEGGHKFDVRKSTSRSREIIQPELHSTMRSCFESWLAVKRRFGRARKGSDRVIARFLPGENGKSLETLDDWV